MRILLMAAVALCLAGNSYGADEYSGNSMVDDILRDVIDRTIEEADRVVRENTGTSLSDIIRESEKYRNNDVSLSDVIEKDREKERGKGSGQGGPPDELRRELHQLSRERNRELEQIKAELERELNQERAEFARENRQDEKPEKLAEKRRKLEEKVQRAYDRFESKMDRENQRYQQKRARIIERGD